MKTLPIWLGHTVAAILSLGAVFFGTFNVLFSDIFGLREQAGAVLYVLIAYFIISSFLHWLWPGHAKSWRLWLIIPAAAFTVFITLSDINNFLYPLTVIAAAVGGSWAGYHNFDRRRSVRVDPLQPPAGTA